MPDERNRDTVRRLAISGDRFGSRWVRYRRPSVWLPPVALAVVAGFLAEVVEPWPEGRILVTMHGLGPHGITTSDLVVVALLTLVSLAWLRAVLARQGPEARPGADPPTGEGRAR